ncbi:MAG: nitrate- and nitrite sensing domain-containing protein [Campylobacterota bacterium]|nr:nitrate- and nitrite sensing domain-containing protein [Campylobacterota bacterium]
MRTLILMLLIFATLNAKSFFSDTEQADNTIYLGSLKDLVIATQKTRGLTNSFLNGNTAAQLLVYINREHMVKAITTMESVSIATDPIISKRASNISDALLKLNHTAFKRQSESNQVFADYTEQIGQILILAQTLSKRSAKDLNPFGVETSKIMMEIMLPMTEYVGQMRGFGSGLAAKKKRSKSELNKILILSNKIKNLNSELQGQLYELTQKYGSTLPPQIIDETASVDKITNSYTNFAEDKFKNEIKNIDPDNYFDNGTNLISHIIKVYNTCNRSILKDSEGWL